MRDQQRGAAAQLVFGIILAVLGVVAIIIAPQVMNSAEIGTLRKIGAAAAVLGALVAVLGMMNKKPSA